MDLNGQCFPSSVSKFSSCFLICRLSPRKLVGSFSDSWMRTLTMATLTCGKLPFLLLLFCFDLKVSEHLIKGTPSLNCALKKIQTAAVQGWIPCCFLPEVAPPPPPAPVLCFDAVASHFHDSVRKPRFLGQRLLVYPGLFGAHTFYPPCLVLCFLFLSSSKVRNICQLICHYKSLNKKVFFMFMTHFCIIGTWRERGWRKLRAPWQLILQGCRIPRWDVRLPWRLHLLNRSFVTDTQGNPGECQKQLANDIFACLCFII